MKYLTNISLAVWMAIVCTFVSNELFAQTNDKTGSSHVKSSEQIQLELSSFDAMACEYETNIMLSPNISFDESSHKQRLMLQPLKDAIESLKRNQPNTDRKEMANLWLKVFTAIDRHSDTNIPSVDISGFIHPPHGYKGKVGP